MRRFIASLLTSTLLLAFSMPALADSPATEAQNTLQHSIDKVFVILNHEKYQNGHHRDEMLDKIDNIIKDIFDYGEFSARTVGKKWRKFSDDEKGRFSDAFADLLRASYLERIKGYSGHGVTYVGTRMSKKGNKVEVQTHLDYKGQDLPVNYRMLQKQTWVVYDVIVEGVSLVKNYRTQFKEILRKETPDALIDRVKQRAAEIRNQEPAQ